MSNELNRIRTRQELTEFAAAFGLNASWHEPDNQRITARVEGKSFDNAGFWPPAAHQALSPVAQELCVVFSLMDTSKVDESGEHPVVEDLAVVNLATLCSWAAR